MMPVIKRNSQASNLTAYLVGPGEKNEHERPHVVAGSPLIVAEHNGVILDHNAGLEIARSLEFSKRLSRSTVPEKHMWHCALSIPAKDGLRTDEEWAKMTVSFMAKMEFVDAEGRADVPWVAVRHGLSEKGNDHVHIIASLIREDGTRATDWNDYTRAQDAAREVEEEHNLTRVAAGFGARGVNPRELSAARERGHAEPEKVLLERQIRAAAALSATEAEFVWRLRTNGVVLRPRMSEDGTKATGVSYGLVAPEGEKQRVVAGGQIANDLTIGAIAASKGWRATAGEVERGHALREWKLAAQDVRSDWSPALPVPGDPDKLMGEAAGQVRAVLRKMESVPYTNHEEWRRTAFQTAGVLSAWSFVLEGEAGGAMRQASTGLGQIAQMSRRAYRPQPARPHVMASMSAAVDAYRRGHKRGGYEVFRELYKLSSAIYKYVEARNDVVKAERLRTETQVQLKQVAAYMETLPRLPQEQTRTPVKVPVQRPAVTPTRAAPRSPEYMHAPVRPGPSQGHGMGR